MTSISEIVYIHNLNDIVNKYKNTYHSAIKRKPEDINDEDPKFKVADIVTADICSKLV